MGREQTPETKAKIRAAMIAHHKEHPETARIRGDKMVGRKLSQDTKDSIGFSMFAHWILHPEERGKLSRIRKDFYSNNPGVQQGDKNPNWRGGSSLQPYPFEFNQDLKDAIRIRDDYKCRVCKMSESRFIRALSIHHIDYNKDNCDQQNLISLCDSCHNATGGSREYWENRLKFESSHSDL